MASDQQQLMRDENMGGERESRIEKDIVPKIKSHFESLAKESGNTGDKNRGERGAWEQEREETQFESLADKVKDMGIAAGDKEVDGGEKAKEIEADEQRGGDMARKEEGDDGEKNKDQTLSLEEISKYRAEAQQKSTEAIRAAEEKSANAANKATDSAGSPTQKMKETSSAAEFATDNGGQANDTIAQGAKAAGLKDKVVVVGWGAANLTAETAVEGTKMAARAVQGVAGYAGETVVSVVHKVVDTAAATGESLKEYTAWKKEEAKRGLEAKKSPEQQGEEKGEGMMEKVQHHIGGGEEEKGSECQEDQQQGGSEVMGGIGETMSENSTMERAKQNDHGPHGQAGSG